MFIEFVLSCSMALLFVYLFMPSLWLTIISADESLDFHESGMALVASRNPFRDDGQVACMAKLIMLRHKIHQTGQRKRKSQQTRHVPRPYNLSPSRPKGAWMRFKRPFGKQSH